MTMEAAIKSALLSAIMFSSAAVRHSDTSLLLMVYRAALSTLVCLLMVDAVNSVIILAREHLSARATPTTLSIQIRSHAVPSIIVIRLMVAALRLPFADLVRVLKKNMNISRQPSTTSSITYTAPDIINPITRENSSNSSVTYVVPDKPVSRENSQDDRIESGNFDFADVGTVLSDVGHHAAYHGQTNPFNDPEDRYVYAVISLEESDQMDEEYA